MNQDIRRTNTARAALRAAAFGGLYLLSIGGLHGSVWAQDVRLNQANDWSSRQPLQVWETVEVELAGPEEGNPFVDVEFSATFVPAGDEGGGQTVAGFYDGEGTYRVRFMPDRAGSWRFTTHSNAEQLDDRAGEFDVVEASGDNHGPVEVCDTFHFAYADRTPYRPLGTTCYAWIHQGEQLEEQTLATLADGPFNKIRMCVFPKRYTWNQNEPVHYPFEGTPPDDWDLARFNPEFFRHLEKRIVQLRELGIEADVILLHPYDKGHWKFDRMPDDADDRYLRYVVSRLAAFRNVWWSLANEYDFMEEKVEADWDRMIGVVDESDPYDRLTSIHNGYRIYDHNNPRLTHACIQNGSAAEDAGRAILYRDVYRKPVVFDEIKYEGNIPDRWGNLSPEEMVHRFWECIIAGTYPGHGECYLHPDDVLWWSKGGVLHGESPARIAFLRDILETAPAEGLEPIDKWQYTNIVGKRGEYYLVYFGSEPRDAWKFLLPRHELEDGMQFQVDVIDTWNMTVTPVEEPITVRQENRYYFLDKDNRWIDLPGRPWMALRITRVDDE